MRRRLQQMFLAAAVMAPLMADAMSGAETVATASMQRMLGQRLVKTYLMLGQQVEVSEARSQRAQALALYDNNLAYLKEGAQSQAMTDLLRQNEQAWKGFRVLLQHPSDRREALELLKQGDNLLALNDRLVDLAREQLGSTRLVEIDGRSMSVTECPMACLSVARLTDIAGREHMLSQRIASLYLAKSWGVAAAGLDQHFREAIEQYEAGLNDLAADPDNTPEAVTALHRVRIMWDFSKKGLGMSANDLFVPVVICGMTEKQLVRMQGVSKIYEEESRRIAGNKTKNPSA